MTLSKIFNKKPDEKTVIVADDVATIRTIVSTVFKKAGYKTFEARNGDEVLSLAREHKPQIIVIDLQMGSRGGISAIDELLLDEELKRIPVVVLSGEKDPKIIEQVRGNANVTDYIIKDQLPNVIKSLEKHV
ncbi:MAG: response regulator [Candidatus Latescibacteria bacterium]|jgi:CheY-like chemotaxis protein|nr:response regulator [Candidatus Latescibacterota bacterium]